MLRRVSNLPGGKSRRNVPAADLTTLGVGGPCLQYTEIENLAEYRQVYAAARRANLPTLVIGEGSNLLFLDHGFAGLVIRNRITGRNRDGVEVEVGGGEDLSGVIRWLNRHRLSGLVRLYGIPGTVAGALVGNAGAYGQWSKKRSNVFSTAGSITTDLPGYAALPVITNICRPFPVSRVGDDRSPGTGRPPTDGLDHPQGPETHLSTGTPSVITGEKLSHSDRFKS